MTLKSNKQAILSAMKPSGGSNPSRSRSENTSPPGSGNSSDPHGSQESFVDARFIARRYSVTPRHILQLAAEGRIPCTRLGAKCIRFLESEVAKVLEG